MGCHNIERSKVISLVTWIDCLEVFNLFICSCHSRLQS